MNSSHHSVPYLMNWRINVVVGCGCGCGVRKISLREVGVGVGCVRREQERGEPLNVCVEYRLRWIFLVDN